VPQGNYYLKVEAENYQNYESEKFEILSDAGVHSNIELKTKNKQPKVFDSKIIVSILSVLVLVLIFYIFYRNKKG
jgi:hypothetical protein